MTGQSPSTSDDFYAGWVNARLDLLGRSIDRLFALLTSARVDDEAWRSAVIAEATLWGALRGTKVPSVPPRWLAVNERAERLLATLVDAGGALRAAVDRRDADLLAEAVGRLDETEALARTVFAAAFALVDEAAEHR